jgi:predicted nucleotidyltransferase
VDGVDVIICDLEDLIVSKELLGREKDRQHLPELRRVALQQPLRPTFDPVDKHDITTDEPEPPSLEL